MTHGLAVSRYSEMNGFNNKSVLCDTFLRIFTDVARYLLQNGLEPETFYRALRAEDGELETRSLEPILIALLPRRKDVMVA